VPGLRDRRQGKPDERGEARDRADGERRRGRGPADLPRRGRSEPGEHELCTGPQHTAERAGQEPEPQEAQGIDPQDEALGRAEGAQDRAVVQVPGREAARSHDDRDAGEAEARERRQPQALLTALEGVTRSGLAGCS